MYIALNAVVASIHPSNWGLLYCNLTSSAHTCVMHIQFYMHRSISPNIKLSRRAKMWKVKNKISILDEIYFLRALAYFEKNTISCFFLSHQISTNI